MISFKDITIVIPTYKRYPFLKRLLKFYKSYNLPINILILDSTPELPSDEELIKLLSKTNILWKKYDFDITYWDRISDGIKYIKTDYVTLCADDDFIIPESLIPCMDFLKKNTDYSSSHGLYFNHSNADQSKKNGFSIGPIYDKGRSADENGSTERIIAYLSGKTNYYPLYAVHRSETFRLIWSETNDYVYDWNLHELFSSCLSLVYGKMKILPIFYSSREPNTYNSNDYEMHIRTFSKFKVDKAVEGVSKHLAIIEKISLKESEKISKTAFRKYLDRSEKRWNNDKLSIWHNIRQIVGLRSRLRKLFLNGCHYSIYPKYYNQYKKVKDAVLSSDLKEEELNISRIDFTKQGEA
mgnify:CR=1 FL=1